MIYVFSLALVALGYGAYRFVRTEGPVRLASDERGARTLDAPARQSRLPSPSPTVGAPRPGAGRQGAVTTATLFEMPPDRSHWLVLKGGPKDGQTFFVGERRVTIGRAPTNQIQVVDRRASRKHCQVSHVPEGLRVVDMSSENSIEINGVATSQGLLRPGDVLKVGGTEFVYRETLDAAVDAGLGRKSTEPATHAATVNAQLVLDPKITVAIDAAGGDLDVAARALNMDPDVLRQVFQSP